MGEVQMHFAHLKIISVGLYKILVEPFCTDCFIQLSQNVFEYLNIITSPVFSTFDQQICKCFHNGQLAHTGKLQF